MDIITDSDGPVLRLRLNRPDKKNAITVAMYAALADALERGTSDPGVRVVTIAGGGGIFTAGNDLKDFMAERPAETNEMPVFRFLGAIAAFPKVIVAGVEGLAVGIGMTMLLHCDLVVAARSARFSLPFVDLALVPEAASSLLLPRLIGRQRAAKHFLLAEPFDAETAYQYGLVTELVEDGEADARMADIARRIAAKPPEAIRITKRLLADPSGTIAERMAEEGALFGDRLRSAEAREAFAAFFEKRAADFNR